MKLVIAIVQDDDALDVIEELNDKGFRVTKLAYYWRIFKIRKYNINDRCRKRKG